MAAHARPHRDGWRGVVLAHPTSGPIALASVVAFGLASLADAGAYHLLAGRAWTVRANGSNVVGATVDSLVFPVMAFGAALPSIVLAQLAAKIAGGMLWAMMIAWLNRIARPGRSTDLP